jgi:hypothetical protein
MLYLSSNFSWDELIDEHDQLTRLIVDKNTESVDELVESHIRKKRYEAIGSQLSQYVKKGVDI